MKTKYLAADNAENIILNCRELYLKYGYRRFLMSKFEDYDLYAVNKSFLMSDSILTFTDKKGKLKALKPDVTLSIVKNICKDELPAKLFYNESVYRPDENGNEFREIMQLGLESIGSNDLYSTAEVIALAVKSLSLISEDYILDISHMGLVSSLLEMSGVSEEKHQSLIGAISRRSTDAVRTIVENVTSADNICRLISEYTPMSEALPVLKEILPESDAITEFCGICEILASLGIDKKIYLDFSLVNDMSYYNGIIFKGFISDVPTEVLSGGRYDPLLSRFGMSCGGCGFAIYLDRLSVYASKGTQNEADVLLLYDGSVSGAAVAKKVNELINSGKTVKAVCNNEVNINAKFGETVKMFS